VTHHTNLGEGGGGGGVKIWISQKYTKFGPLIIRKIIKNIDTICHILRLKCKKNPFLVSRPSVGQFVS